MCEHHREIWELNEYEWGNVISSLFQSFDQFAQLKMCCFLCGHCKKAGGWLFSNFWWKKSLEQKLFEAFYLQKCSRQRLYVASLWLTSSSFMVTIPSWFESMTSSNSFFLSLTQSSSMSWPCWFSTVPTGREMNSDRVSFQSLSWSAVKQEAFHSA